MDDMKFTEPPTEGSPLLASHTNTTNYNDNNNNDSEDDGSEMDGTEYFEVLSGKASSARQQSIAADHLSERLLAIDDDDDEMQDRILHEVLNLDMGTLSLSEGGTATPATTDWKDVGGRLCSMTTLFILAIGLMGAATWISGEFIGPPNQPVGPYELIELQEGDHFFEHYTFLEGPDSVGSNGYITYVSEQRAEDIAIANIRYEMEEVDAFDGRRLVGVADGEADKERSTTEPNESNPTRTKPFVYLKTAATEAGPRESIRLEGKKRFNRGLFIIDVRHIPVGCGAWPAFWLTDEANWPVNGEIDIVEGINFQTEAKTALHTTKRCNMQDVPLGTMTGTWDTAVGIPDRKTGIPDMTFREARNCYVYDPHQWLNQGCVTIDTDGGSLGAPLNEKGGGIFALEWDPAYRHIRTWVFAPHTRVPENLAAAIRTANAESESDRVMPNPEEWPLPYGFFPIGGQTNCQGTKFRNMRLVLNTALCGSVSGNRFFVDCKNESKIYKSCEEYIKNSTEAALGEFYWKIGGVYVYQREWEKAWLGH